MQTSHPWRIMTFVFAAVLLCSMALDRLLAPAGDAILNALDRQPSSAAPAQTP